MSSVHKRRRRRLYVLSAVAALVSPVAVVAGPAAASPTTASPTTASTTVATASPQPVPRSDPAAPAGLVCPDGIKTTRFTLLTGDVVGLGRAPTGGQCGTVISSVGGPAGVQFTTEDGDLYAFTGPAVRLIGDGRLDRRLFDLTKLAEDGYDDARVGTLPVITTGAPGARSAAPLAVPKGTKRVAALPSVGGQALTVTKSEAKQAWSALSATTGQQVWLDDKLKASLDVSVPAIGAPSAWAAGYDGSGTKIAILDTGIDLDHPDFAGRIGATTSVVPGAGVRDGNGHGTHVASIVAGSGAASGKTYRGVAPGATLLVGKVLDDTGAGQESWIIAGMQWAAEQGAKVANISLGGSADDGVGPLAQALNEISGRTGTLFVVAAGNDGHSPDGIGTPGGADQALTVGSVAKTAPYAVSSFSSVGPRLRDGAIKPDLTAPGEDIVAARASGTELGTPVGDRYTTLSGTSMATPHVTGAAALLAEQHPDWTGQQLADALVSTATPNPDAPVAWQGGGMVNVSEATGSPLVATRAVNLGQFSPPYPQPVKGTVTLRNVSDRSVTAELDLDLRRLSADRATDDSYAPAEGAVTVSPSSVSIPAGGTATVTLSVQLATFSLATYAGWLRASVDGQVVAHTTVSWTKNPEMHRLTVRGIDRTGAPANTTTASWLLLVQRDPAPQWMTEVHGWLGYWADGAAHFEGLGVDPLLPPGRYALLGNISDWTTEPVYVDPGVGPAYERLSESIFSETNLVMDGDHSFTYDARQAKQLSFRTPRPAELTDKVLGYRVIQRWFGAPASDGESHVLVERDFGEAPSVYLFPAKNAEPPNAPDRFSFWFNTVLAPSRLSLTPHGQGLPTLHPEYPHEAFSIGTLFTSCETFGVTLCNTWFPSGRTSPLVDAGSGSPGDLAKAHPQGRLVLVREAPDHDQWQVDGVAAAAKRAGAVGVLYGIADAGVAYRGLSAKLPIPVAVLQKAEADRLGAALARRGQIPVRTDGQPQSPYVYWLDYRLDGPFPKSAEFDIRSDQLATVQARYHADKPGTVLLAGSFEWNGASPARNDAIIAPTTRTEYLLGGAQQDFWLYNMPQQSPYRYQQGIRAYSAKSSTVADYWSRPIAPGAGNSDPAARCALCGPALQADTHLLQLDPRIAQSGSGELAYDSYGGQVSYSRDGHVVCDRYTVSQACDTSGVAGSYQIHLQTTNDGLPVGPTETTWQVGVRLAEKYGDQVVQPLVNLTYSPTLDGLLNSVRAGSRYSIPVTVGYQAGYGRTSTFTVSAWASYDHGTTWKALGTQRADRSGKAAFSLQVPPDATATSLRVKAVDKAGNFEDQTVLDAWPVTPGQRG